MPESKMIEQVRPARQVAAPGGRSLPPPTASCLLLFPMERVGVYCRTHLSHA